VVMQNFCLLQLSLKVLGDLNTQKFNDALRTSQPICG
jgi:hypothetical protein